MRPMASLIQMAALLVAAGFMCLNRSETPNSSFAKGNPFCTCRSCDCEDCSCTPLQTFEPLTDRLVVGPPPDIVNLTDYRKSTIENRQIATGNRDSQANYRSADPPPGLIFPVSTKTIAKTQEAPSGHWETRSAGLRGRRAYQVWVPHAAGACSAGSCSTDSCTAAGCSSGSCQPQQYFFGSGGCASCGRGRR